MIRLAQNLVRIASFHDDAIRHEDRFVRYFPGERYLVRYHQHRYSGIRHLLHHGQHFADQLWIQGGSRLVEEHDFRLHRQRTGNCDALLLAT